MFARIFLGLLFVFSAARVWSQASVDADLGNLSVLSDRDLPKALDLAVRLQERSEGENWSADRLSRLALLRSELAYREGNYNDALRYATQAIEAAYQSPDSAHSVECHLQFGAIYLEKGYADKAMEYQTRALNRAERLGRAGERARCLQGLSRSRFYVRQWEQADTLLQEALRVAYAQLPSDSLLLAELLIDQGRLHLFLERYDSAAFCLEQGLAWAERNGRPRVAALALRTLGSLQLRLRQYEGSAAFYNKASALYQGLGDRVQYARTLQGLGELELELGKPERAQKYLQEALTIARLARSKPLARDLYADLYRCFLQAQNPAQALEYFRKFHVINDSISGQERAERIAEIQAKYENEKLEREKLELAERNRQQASFLRLREQELELEQLANSRSRLLIVALAASLVLLLVIALLVVRQNRLKSRIRESELREQALNAQMNPHFLFNALNSVQSLIAGGDNAQAGIYLARFSKLMRAILQNARRTDLSLSEEMEFLRNYIELEKRRFEHRFYYTVSCEAELEEESAGLHIPGFVVQPFVENAILHGLLPKGGGGKLSVHFDQPHDGVLRCTVRDDGIGRAAAGKKPKASPRQHESLGIAIVRERLSRLHGKRGQAEPLRIRDLHDESGQAVGTQVEILLPLLPPKS